MGRRFAIPAGLSCLTQAPPRAFRFDRGAPTPESFRFVADNPAQIAAAASEGAARRFEGTAYSGDKITGHWYWGDVVFDLSKTSAPQKLPMLLGHDNDKVVGFSDSVAITNDIKVGGALSRVTEEGKQVAALSDEGFPWQMSVRIEPSRVDEIGAGETVSVNGRTFSGPINVFRNSVIREISFTPTGWDAQTSATAMARGQHQEVEMDPKELEKLQAQAAQAATFEASAKAEKEAREKAEADKVAAEAKVAEFEAANAKTAKDKRDADVKKLFADCRLQLTDATAKPYVEMTEEVFAAIATQMRASAKQANPDLFREQATSGASGGEVDANALAAKAKELMFAAEQKGVSLDAVDAVKQAKVLLLGAGA